MDYPQCGNYAGDGYTCVGFYCAGMNPTGNPDQCAQLKPAGYVVDESTGRCVLPGCWEADTTQYPWCGNYIGDGYTCVGTQCAIVTAKGDPDQCAKQAPAGYVVDASTGHCVDPAASTMTGGSMTGGLSLIHI